MRRARAPLLPRATTCTDHPERIYATFFNIKHELSLGSAECGRMISVRVSDRDRVPVAFSYEPLCRG